MEMMSGFVNLLGAPAHKCRLCRKSEITANTSTPGGAGGATLHPTSSAQASLYPGVVAAYTLHPTLFPFYENQYVI